MLDLFNSRQKARYSSQRSKLRFLSAIAVSFFISLLLLVFATGFLFAWYAKDLPRPDKIKRVEGLSTVILDRNGQSIYDIYENVNRLPVKWEDAPQYLKDATIAVEDKDFYTHQGLSTRGILRAIVNIFFFHNFQGGSTLTQQLVKNVLLTNERTLPRKIKEAILAIQIERKYTKDEILRMYLNEAPYGGTAVGVEAASKSYFDKPVKNLSLIESAILAGLPQSPSLYSPFTGEPKAYIGRTLHVLRRMREDGYISPSQEEMAKKSLDVVVFAQTGSLTAPHFVAYVKDQLVEKFGSKMVEGGGLKVTTTLDKKLQEKAQSIVNEEVTKAKYLKVTNGATVVLDPSTGEILAMVGSKDYQATDSGGYKFNVVTQGLRQPGSAIKPISYATAFQKGYTAATLLMDVDTKYPSGDPKKPEYNPHNYDDKFRGPIQLRYALGNSINTIAVKVTALVGIKDVLRTAFDMGVTTLEPTDDNIRRLGLSLTLGGGEVKLLDLTSAFGVFATGGLRQEPTSILKVEDTKGNVLFEHKAIQPRRVLSTEVAYLITHILSDNGARREVFGERSYLSIPGRSIFVKTGTTDDKRDNWTLGGSRQRIVGVWVGNNDNSPMHPSLASGVTGAAPIWNRLIREAIKDMPDEPFERPENIIEMDIDAVGGGLPVSGYATRKEIFIKGTEPTSNSPIYQTFKISKKDSSKLANPVEVAKGEYDTKTFILFTENDPASSDGKNRWQEAIDEWVSAQGDPKYHPPKDTYEGTPDQIAVSIKEPGDKTQINDNNVKVKAQIGTVNEVSKVEIMVDGVVVKTVSGIAVSENITVGNGQRTISVKATDDKGHSSQADVHIGVNTPYVSPVPTAAPTSTP